MSIQRERAIGVVVEIKCELRNSSLFQFKIKLDNFFSPLIDVDMNEDVGPSMIILFFVSFFFLHLKTIPKIMKRIEKRHTVSILTPFRIFRFIFIAFEINWNEYFLIGLRKFDIFSWIRCGFFRCSDFIFHLSFFSRWCEPRFTGKTSVYPAFHSNWN